jgi:hypothetical protein
VAVSAAVAGDDAQIIPLDAVEKRIDTAPDDDGLVPGAHD